MPRTIGDKNIYNHIHVINEPKPLNGQQIIHSLTLKIKKTQFVGAPIYNMRVVHGAEKTAFSSKGSGLELDL